MPHTLTRCIMALLLFTSGAATVHADEDTIVLGRKQSEWMKFFYQGDKVKVRMAGLRALEIYGPKKDGVLKALLERLREEPDEELRQEIATALGRMGEDAKFAIMPLAQAMRGDKSPRVRESAARALGGAMAPYSKKAAKDLGAALADADDGVRGAAAETLMALGADALPALSALLDAARQPKLESTTKVYVLQTLGRIGQGAARETGPVLVDVLKNTMAPLSERIAAAEALGRLGTDQPVSTVDVLVATLAGSTAAEGTPQFQLRKAALLSFAKIDAISKEHWPKIKSLLAEENSFLRLQAVRLVGALGKEVPEVVPELEKIARKDPNLEARIGAVQELGALGSSAKRAEPTLTAISRNETNPALRDAAQAALKKIAN